VSCSSTYPLKKKHYDAFGGSPSIERNRGQEAKKERKELGGDANALLGLVLVMDMEQLSFSFLSSLDFEAA
jgi:hypothetical protein